MYLQREQEIENFSYLPWYKRMTTSCPYPIRKPTWYNSIVECFSYQIGENYYSGQVELRYDKGFFLFMGENTPDGPQGCTMDIDSGEINTAQCKFAYTRLASEKMEHIRKCLSPYIVL